MKNHLRQTIENFYYCTNISVKVFGTDGTHIHSAGYNKEFYDLFYENDIYARAKDILLTEDEGGHITIECLGDIYFSAFQDNNHLFILGPYTTKDSSDVFIPYKPSCCILHIISLLKNIDHRAEVKEIKKTIRCAPYSFYVNKAIQYAHRNYHNHITSTDIADYLNINNSYFCTLFKRETGKTFSVFLNELRIKRSKCLLSHKDLSMLDVSFSCGFKNQSYYNKLFKEITGKTPLEYRNSVPSRRSGCCRMQD